MRVRRKSEIAAEQVWNFVYSEVSESCTDDEEIAEIAAIIATHYEPVPEPPAGFFQCQSCGRISNTAEGQAHECAVSEEQPAVVVRSATHPENTAAPGVGLLINNATPHRATIAVVPWKWKIEIDGVTLNDYAGYTLAFCTEAEAKAKLESLRGENNGDK